MGKSAPKPTDPKETSAAQTGSNVSTAIANSFMGNVNKVGPDGTTTYDQSGSYTWSDPYTGQSYTVPRFTENVTLSPQQQATYNASKAAEGNLANLAKDQSGFLQGYLNKPIDLNNNAVESRLYDLGSKRLDPRFKQDEEALRTRLANSGIREGTAAFDSAFSNFSQSKNDAYNQLLLQGRGQAVQEALTQRNQPINEITALLSGSQVSMPQFTGGNMSNIPTTDNAGIISNYDNQKMQAWQQQQAGLGGLFSGIGGLAGKMIGLSDDEAKKNKKRHGDVDGDMGLWTFNYKGEPKGTPKHVGLMASEVEKVKPSAVKRGKDGLRRVDYGKALGLMDS